MKRFTLNTLAFFFGIVMAPIVATICAIIAFFKVLTVFWSDCFAAVDEVMANGNQPNTEQTIWDRHIERQNQKKQNQ
jgi:hypothetical protein